MITRSDKSRREEKEKEGTEKWCENEDGVRRRRERKRGKRHANKRRSRKRGGRRVDGMMVQGGLGKERW